MRPGKLPVVAVAAFAMMVLGGSCAERPSVRPSNTVRPKHAPVGTSDSVARPGKSHVKTSKPVGKPKLLRVSLYMSGLSTGRIAIDLRLKRLRVLAVGASPGWERADATLARGEITQIRKLISSADLRGIAPDRAWFTSRQPNLDECPPILAIEWSDRERVFRFPLRGTIKPSAPAKGKRWVRQLDAIDAYLWALRKRHAKGTALSVIPFRKLQYLPEYQAYERERQRVRGLAVP